MENIIAHCCSYMVCPTKYTVRQWGVALAGLSALVIAMALISQYAFGMQPCKLCIWQRWPYAFAIVLGGALVVLHDNRKIALALLIALCVTFLVGAGLALFHTGVEYHWWTFASDCTNEIFKPKASVDELLAALREAPTVRCDERRPFLFGMTMAFYNIFVSLGFAGLTALALVFTQRSNSLSQ